MTSVSATRSALLALKRRAELAGQARELLEKKRAALVKELLEGAETAIQEARALDDAATAARRALARAERMAGSEAVLSAALAARSELALEMDTLSIMGVDVPRVEQKQVARPACGRGYSVVGQSTSIDEAAAAFEAEVEGILLLAESELRLARLTTEIQQTSRRLNALDHVVIPRLRDECHTIQMILDERERFDIMRLRRAKAMLQNREADDGERPG